MKGTFKSLAVIVSMVIAGLFVSLVFKNRQLNSTASKGRPLPFEKLSEPPIPHLQYNYTRSLDLTVYSAVFDKRPRNNHDNVTVLFITVARSVFDKKLIVGCGADDRKASNFSVYNVYENTLMHKLVGPGGYLFENVLVLCYDMQVANGSSAFVIYKRSPSSQELFSLSEKPVHIPSPRIQTSGEQNLTVLTCVKVWNRNVPWLREFVQYQKTLLVDHVHVIMLEHFVKDGGFRDHIENDPPMQEAYKNGYLSFGLWKWEDHHYGGNVHNGAEILRKLDCIYRFRGTYDYIFSLDTDDFFVSRSTEKTNVKDFIKEHCYAKPAGSCQLNWMWLYVDCGLNGKIGPDGNVTNHLKSFVYLKSESHNWKSVHSSEAILDASFHSSICKECLRPGYRAIHIPTSIAYVAHNRHGSGCKLKGPLV